MKTIMTVLITIASLNAAIAKPRECNPETSKPCGMSCIKKEFTCHKAPGGPNAAVVKKSK